MADATPKPKKRFGDRKDARWLRDLDPFHKLLPYVLVKRCDSEVYIAETLDVTELLKYIKAKKEMPEHERLTFFHAILTSIAKTVHFRPYLNRYIVNKRFYQRDDISLSFITKRKFEDHSEESIMVLTTKDDDNIFSISNKIVGDVDKVRKDGSNSMDKMIEFFMKLPRPILKFFFWMLKRLENHGLMPSALTDGDSNYSSVLVANLGSIKCDAIYHHINEYGTNSIVITIGTIHKENVLQEDGSYEPRDVCDFGVTIDERIADGFYFARSIDLLRKYLQNPETLELGITEEVTL